MAIESICKGCAKRLRVADEFAGRKARCPHCKTIYTVPGSGSGSDPESVAPVSAAGTTDSPSQPFAQPDTSEEWRVRTHDGAIYGPVSKAELDQWVQEGRVATHSELQRNDSTEWVAATIVYPALDASSSSSANPFAENQATPASPNPYAATPQIRPGPRRYLPHRGGLILTFAILGFVCCQFLSIAAWVMGYQDLRKIDAGQMDPRGRGLTQAGMIIGIVGTVWMIIVFLMQIGMLAANA